jgi:hypothetical protein
MAKRMKRRSTSKKHHRAPTAKAKAKYYDLIRKGAQRTMMTLKKHDPAAARKIINMVGG